MSGEARQHYQQRWRHVLVDEFQDTSLSQYELIRTLALPQNKVFVVGDVDQAIYSWRGAEVANIRTKFDEDFAGAETVMLNKNYRSTATIVKAAQAVIGESKGRSPLELDAVTPGGKDVAVVATEDEVEEAEFCACEAAKIARGGVPLKEIAVLYRTHSQSRPLEEAFIRAGVPHVVVGDTAFYTRKEIKDAVAYLRVLLNPRDTVSLQRIINTPPRKIGPGTMDKLQLWAEDLPWVDGMPQPLGLALLQQSWAAPDEALNDDAVLPPAKEMGLGAGAHRAVSEFVRLMRNLTGVMEDSNPGQLIEEVVKSVGFEAYITEQENRDERWGGAVQVVCSTTKKTIC
jgi:DNA helicase-2/ATP-dependent DNA helicase PcrA